MLIVFDYFKQEILPLSYIFALFPKTVVDTMVIQISHNINIIALQWLTTRKNVTAKYLVVHELF